VAAQVNENKCLPPDAATQGQKSSNRLWLAERVFGGVDMALTWR
jgi:hypothetical protein